MAGRGSPTFLKRQKEQKRAAKAAAKRAAQQARRDRKAARAKNPEAFDDDVSEQDGVAEQTAEQDTSLDTEKPD